MQRKVALWKRGTTKEPQLTYNKEKPQTFDDLVYANVHYYQYHKQMHIDSDGKRQLSTKHGKRYCGFHHNHNPQKHHLEFSGCCLFTDPCVRSIARPRIYVCMYVWAPTAAMTAFILSRIPFETKVFFSFPLCVSWPGYIFWLFLAPIFDFHFVAE